MINQRTSLYGEILSSVHHGVLICKQKFFCVPFSKFLGQLTLDFALVLFVLTCNLLKGNLFVFVLEGLTSHYYTILTIMRKGPENEGVSKAKG